ncbi:hypothetical protein SARC_10279 [Sphaeroforma arctica JP610]|uniref:Uncharacterized protein n=1 Tax=Sphaeroforma arctica JP610 TaxID=667725 RepID=A0A0L0FKG9_9EUKA|nr:hypothetical protein SARC_10279 [Sphaeroforma arctica JP610]KNC77255.1 hypothetical protein SARC_10279 [Sphaeroforma arctica JP610]|eukprot:XP_014151157.1 hypothetical protein SARC_10279 [Sphaeroforma arctica JP610]
MQDTQNRVCNCQVNQYTTTYTRTTVKSERGEDCKDANGNIIAFDDNEQAVVTNDGDCVCACGNGIVDYGNGESCDLGKDSIISDTVVCEDCKVVDSRCGDYEFDDIRNEECDPPYSQSGEITENQEYCTNNCK